MLAKVSLLVMVWVLYVIVRLVLSSVFIAVLVEVVVVLGI